LGNYFRDVREERRRSDGDKWSLRGAASLAARDGLSPPLTYQVLFRLEGGQIRHIAPELLRAVATLYGLAYSDLVSRYIASEYGLQVGGSDLTGHSGTGDSALFKGGAARDDQTAAHAREVDQLNRRLVEYQDLIREMQDVASRLFALSIRDSETGAAAGAPPARTRHHRKAR
jgi:hypothetical protein